MNKPWENETEFIKGMLEKSSLFLLDEDMDKIQNTTVAHAGFGGIGALVLELLTRWGIKKFRLLDMDKYELSNMNRQVFATIHTLGKYKAEVAESRIKEINPYTSVEKVYCEKLTRTNVGEFVKDASVIINGIDFPSGQLPLHYYAKTNHIPVINPHCMNVTKACIEVFDYRQKNQQSIDEPTRWSFINNFLYEYFNIFQFNKNTLSDTHLSRLDKKFKTAGTLNFVTNLAACLAVAETIKLITGKGRQVLYPKQIIMDPYNLQFKVRSVYNFQRFINYIKERWIKR